MVNNPLIRPYFLGVALGGGPLDSHNGSSLFLKKNMNQCNSNLTNRIAHCRFFNLAKQNNKQHMSDARFPREPIPKP